MSSTAPAPLRVLQLVHSAGLGGAQILMLNLTRALAAHSVDSLVCAWRIPGGHASQFPDAGIPLVVPRVHTTGWRRLMVPGMLHSLVERYRIDLIHAHMSDCATWGAVLQALSGRPCVVTHHSTDLIDTVGRGRPLYTVWRYALLALSVRAVVANVGSSDSVRDALVTKLRLSPTRVQVVPNSVPQPPPETVERSRAERRLRAAAGFHNGPGPRLLNVGHLTPVKSVETLIAALPRVLERYPHARLDVIGNGRPDTAYRAQARALGVADQVHLHGIVREVEPWLQQADLYVSASRVEGLSMAVMEAMSYGLGMVLSDIPSHRELADDGQAGLLFTVGSPQRLADTILAALDNLPSTEARAERALARVRAHYSADLMARRYLGVYRAALREFHAPRG